MLSAGAMLATAAVPALADHNSRRFDHRFQERPIVQRYHGQPVYQQSYHGRHAYRGHPVYAQPAYGYGYESRHNSASAATASAMERFSAAYRYGQDGTQRWRRLLTGGWGPRARPMRSRVSRMVMKERHQSKGRPSANFLLLVGDAEHHPSSHPIKSSRACRQARRTLQLLACARGAFRDRALQSSRT